MSEEFTAVRNALGTTEGQQTGYVKVATSNGECIASDRSAVHLTLVRNLSSIKVGIPFRRAWGVRYKSPHSVAPQRTGIPWCHFRDGGRALTKMTKRMFIRLLAAIVAAPVVMRLLAWAGGERLKNWAGNLEYSTDRLYAATSLQQVQDHVKSENRLKALGTRHCFNNIADSKDSFLSLKPMSGADREGGRRDYVWPVVSLP